MFIHSIHEKIMLSRNTDELVTKNFQSFKNKYNDLDKEMEASGFSFKFVSRLKIRRQKLNVARRSSWHVIG